MITSSPDIRLHCMLNLQEHGAMQSCAAHRPTLLHKYWQSYSNSTEHAQLGMPGAHCMQQQVSVSSTLRMTRSSPCSVTVRSSTSTGVRVYNTSELPRSAQRLM